jgi:hypothetical protein
VLELRGHLRPDRETRPWEDDLKRVDRQLAQRNFTKVVEPTEAEILKHRRRRSRELGPNSAARRSQHLRQVRIHLTSI